MPATVVTDYQHECDQAKQNLSDALSSVAIYKPSLSGLSCRVLSSAAIVGLSLLLIAAAAAKPCLTKEQAMKLWPSEWLYWPNGTAGTA